MLQVFWEKSRFQILYPLSPEAYLRDGDGLLHGHCDVSGRDAGGLGVESLDLRGSSRSAHDGRYSLPYMIHSV